MFFLKISLPVRNRISITLPVLLLLLATSVYGATDDAARKVYAKHADQVLQVRIIDRSSGSKSSIGSGFVVGDGSLIVTNYHVVSELIERPKSYRVEYQREDGSSGDLQLLGIDVVHDLALLKAESVFAKVFKLAQRTPKKGESLYAFGNPHDLGLTIVQGTYNGLLEKSLYEKIHFTASINPGMSGGPTVNRAGEVVGVNVSTAGNQLSFLVPVKNVAALLAATADTPPATDVFVQQIGEQLFANQMSYMTKLLESELPTVKMADYTVPGELAAFIKCWGNTSDNKEQLYEKVFKTCSTSDDIFLNRDHSTGVIKFRHELFSTEKLGSIRFYNLLEKHFNRSHLGLRANKKGVGNFTCSSDLVSGNDIDTKAVLCLRAYKKYDNLFDLFLSVNTLMRSDEALHSTLALSGVSRENALRFAQTYLEAFSWNRQ